MPSRRICYVSRLPESPVGGIATMWRHVEHLVASGFRAVAVLPPDQSPDACPVPAISEAELRNDDFLVFPEAWRARLQQWADFPAEKAVFVQNHFLVEPVLRGAADFGVFGLPRAFACSGIVAGALRQRCGYADVPVVPCGIDLNVFRPRAKRLLIALMPRKRPLESLYIVGRFLWRFPQFRQFRFIELVGRPRAEVAEVLGAATIFLSLSFLEGLGLPPLEAMASDCLVVGYHGDGGREYARPDNGLWIDEGHSDACVEALGRAAAIVAAQEDELADRLDAGRQTAARFSLEVERQALVEYWKRLAPAARG